MRAQGGGGLIIQRHNQRSCIPYRAVLKGGKKVFQNCSFAKKTACSSYAKPWLVAIGAWQLALGGCWRLVAAGGGWWLPIDGWCGLVVGVWWRLAVGGWWLAAVGGWRLPAVGS